MYSGYDIHLSGKRSDLCDLSAVGSLVILEDHLSDSLLLILVYSIGDKSRPLLVVGKCLLYLLLYLAHSLLTSLLVIIKYSLFHLLGRDYLLYLLKERIRNSA